MRQHANACRAIRPNCVAGEHLPDKDAVSRQRMPRSLQPADRVDAQNRRPGLPSGALCQADQSPALPSCASFLPREDMSTLPFPRRTGKPLIVLGLYLRTSDLPVLISNRSLLCPCRDRGAASSRAGKKCIPVAGQAVRHTRPARKQTRDGPLPSPTGGRISPVCLPERAALKELCDQHVP